jgi:hypothetical protein
MKQPNDGLPFKNIKEAEHAVISAVSVAVHAVNVEGDLQEACDAYTRAARSFAALILAERIRRTTATTLETSHGHSNESLAEKIEHARNIREMLAPWNLGLCDTSTGTTYQIRACSNGTQGGHFRLRAYGNDGSHSSWNFVKSILTQPALADTTQFVYRSNVRDRYP